MVKLILNLFRSIGRLLSGRRSVVLTVHHGGILRRPEQHMLPGANLAEISAKFKFWYMFPELQKDPKNLLPQSETTVSHLRYIGSEAMRDQPTKIPGVPVPAIYTFLGQFIDHDITLMDDQGAPLSLANPTPLSPDQIQKIVNARSPNLDLDNVYGPNLYGQLSPTDPTDKRKMALGKVRPKEGLPDGVPDEWQDLPRPDNTIASIGDPRDDENLIIAQLHVAFLRAHNAIVDKLNCGFEEAKKQLIQHYQWIVLDDFLEQTCDPDILKKIRDGKPAFFNPPPESFYMPFEFSLAAYRFGHSKVRAAYANFNSIQPEGGFDFLFGFTQKRIPDNWIISWPSFLDPKNMGRHPRPIDTTLSPPLLSIPKEQLNGHDPLEGNLAVRNLLRGYMLRLPTGQAVAKAMASQGIVPLTPDEIMSVAAKIPIGDTQTQADFLKNTDFANNTPLWFYILAEAALGGGVRLGKVGSTIVAEVLIGVLRNSTYSILREPGWKPTLGDKFHIEDLLELAASFKP